MATEAENLMRELILNVETVADELRAIRRYMAESNQIKMANHNSHFEWVEQVVAELSE